MSWFSSEVFELQLLELKLKSHLEIVEGDIQPGKD